ncbi:MAG: hypothetical protein HUU02_09845 [Bacteroidetes bacterium]|nr:hypothetical protein [Bacteroidota bacterium]
MRPFLSLTALIVLLTAGCAEKPNSVGNGLPNTDGDFAMFYDTLRAVSDTSYTVAYAPGSSLSDLSGRLNANESVISLLNFTGTSLVDSLRGATIDSVRLMLTVNYRFTPAAPPIAFSLVEVKSPWSSTTFTKDSMPLLQLGTSVLGTFSDSMNFLSIPYTFIADTSVIRRWAQYYYDTSSAVPEFYGFAVVPQAGATTGIVGFSSFNNYVGYAPTMVIKFTRNGRRDSVVFSNGEDTYATITTGAPAPVPMTVRGAFGTRSKVTFDHRMLRDTVNTAVKTTLHKATLELMLDSVASTFSGFAPDTVVAIMGMPDGDIDRSDSSVFAYGVRRAGTGGQPPVYSFTVTNIADLWVQGLKQNKGITLRWGAEYGSAEQAVFYRYNDPVPSRRPRMIVTYSKK